MSTLVLDPANQDLVDNPYLALSRIREQGSVVPIGGGLFAVTRHADVVDVLARAEDFSSALANISPSAPDPEADTIRSQGWPPVPALLTADPPTHARHRRIVQQAFSGPRTAQLTGVVTAIIRDLVDAFPPDRAVELRSMLAEPLPLAMITSALGLPRADVDRVHQWSDAVVARIGRRLSPSEQRDVARANLGLQQYLVGALEERRAQPTNDLLSDVAQVSQAEDGPLTTAEMLTILEQVLVAGNETTTRLIVFVARNLAMEPALQDLVRANPGNLPSLIEETLRIESPVQSKIRVAVRDTTVGDIPLTAGTRLLVHLGAANHDPAVFPDPDALDIDRSNVRDHLAFGYGRHFCVGATLARTEVRLAITALLDRYARIEMAPDHPQPRYEASLVHRGLDHLWLRLRA